MRKIILAILVTAITLCMCGCGNDDTAYPISNDYIDISRQVSLSPSKTTESMPEESSEKISEELISEKAVDDDVLFTISNGYRFKNSVDEVNLSFLEIKLCSEWGGIEPINGAFLIMKVEASSNTVSSALYTFPEVITVPSGETYISRNSRPFYYIDADGNTVDIATELNAEYVRKDDGKISAYNTDYVKSGNGTRYLVFDITMQDACDPDSYLIFLGTTQSIYRNEVSDVYIYFSEYISDET